jgi:hypothetical protein
LRVAKDSSLILSSLILETDLFWLLFLARQFTPDKPLYKSSTELSGRERLIVKTLSKLYKCVIITKLSGQTEIAPKPIDDLAGKLLTQLEATSCLL